MDTFGERLTSEREGRGLSIPAVAGILGVDEEPLRALERNDFGALPDEATMMRCLRAYAACLEVDADLMLQDYTRERERCLRRLADAVTEGVAETAAERTPPIPRWLTGPVIVAAVGVLAIWWVFSGGVEPSAGVPVETRPATPETRAEPTPAPAERPVERVAPTPAVPATLSVTEFGVGTAVENRRLVGKSDRFAEGTQVWFWTRVEGGKRGDRIEHVWLREGVEATSVTLRIGGSRWRTHSAKMLHPGSAGSWTVEARDASGRVLARREFACTP